MNQEDQNGSGNHSPHIIFSLIYTQGENWDNTKPYQQQNYIEDHVKYMAEHLEKGNLLLDGPFLNNAGALAFIDKIERDDVMEIVKHDPLVEHNILHVDVKPLLIPFFLPNDIPDLQIKRLQIMHIIFHTAGPRWVEDLPFQQQPGIDLHIKYYSMVFKNKKILMGGPYVEDKGGIIILYTENAHEAHTIAINDPAVRRNLLQASIFPYVAPLKWR